MRDLRRIGLLAISVVCVLGFSAVSAFADTGDELLTAAGGVALRDIGTPSVNQPSAIELVNTATTKWEVPGVSTTECVESEFGTFVTKNKAANEVKAGAELSVPFGVFENCTETGFGNAPVLVDTVGAAKAQAGIEARIWDEAPAVGIKVELKNLNISLYIKKSATEEVVCKFSGPITGVWTNGAGPFTEEASTNQSMADFTNQKLTSPTCGTATITSAKYFVETMSDSKNFTGSSDTVNMPT